MPESDPTPKTEPAFIWIISCILFICIAAGGGCLFAYITASDSQPSPLFLITGFILVCMPWIFWLTTFVYRLISRSFGFRMVIGNSYYSDRAAAGGGGAGEASGQAIAAMDDIRIHNGDAESSSAGNNGRQAQLDGAAMVNDNQQNGQERNILRSCRSSSNDTSVASHDQSELPLALSMIS